MSKRTRMMLGGIFFALMLFNFGARAWSDAYGRDYASRRGWFSEIKDGRHYVSGVSSDGLANPLAVGDEILEVNLPRPDAMPLVSKFHWRVPPGTVYGVTILRNGVRQPVSLRTDTIPDSRETWADWVFYASMFLFIAVGLALFISRAGNQQITLLAFMLGAVPALFRDDRYIGLPRGVTLVMLCGSLIAPICIGLFLHFFLTFPRTPAWLQRRPHWERWLYVPLIISITANGIFQFLRRWLEAAPAWFAIIGRSRWWLIIDLNFIGILYLASGLIAMFVGYRAANPDERRRLRVMMTGCGIGIINILLTLVGETFQIWKYSQGLWEIIDVSLLFTLPLIPLAFAYAIVRHKALSVSLIIRRGVRYMLVTRGTIIFETLLAVCLAVIYVKAFFHAWNLKHVMFSATIGIAAWKLIDRLHRKFVAPVIDRKFFRQSYDAQRIIGELSDSLRTARDLPHLFELLATNLQRALQTESVYVFMKDDASGEFQVTYACEYESTNGRSINCQSDSRLAANAATIGELSESDAPLELEWPTENNGKPVWVGKTQSLFRFSSDELQVLQTLRPALFLPLKVKGELSGVVALGARLGDLPFSNEDKRLVMSVGAPTGLALENARLIDQMIAEARRREELEAENEARARELEEARQLQLSMLPKRLPELPNLEIAAYMKTATEVGGDYYDFHLSSDGILTLAVGDATGHGLKAGTVVTAMKSLFHTHAHQTEMLPVFAQSSRVLKEMNLRSLFMALTMVKLAGNQLNLVSAGMPPALIYHSQSGEIEEVLMKSMPLGSMRNYPYTEKTFSLHSGDVVVLMSDGFPERFNAHGEMIGFDKAEEVLAKAFHLAPTQIIERFVQAEDEWAQGFAPNDDVTFVVLKIK